MLQTVATGLTRFFPDIFAAAQDVSANFLLKHRLHPCANFGDNVELAQQEHKWNEAKVHLLHSLTGTLPIAPSTVDRLSSWLGKRSVSGRFKFQSLAQPFMEEFLYSFLLTPRAIPTGLQPHKSHSRNPSDTSSSGQTGIIRPTKLKFSFALSWSGQPPFVFFSRYCPPKFWGSLLTYPQYDLKSVLSVITPAILSGVIYSMLAGKNILIVAKNADLLYPAVQLFIDLLSPM